MSLKKLNQNKTVTSIIITFLMITTIMTSTNSCKLSKNKYSPEEYKGLKIASSELDEEYEIEKQMDKAFEQSVMLTQGVYEQYKNDNISDKRFDKIISQMMYNGYFPIVDCYLVKDSENNKEIMIRLNDENCYISTITGKINQVYPETNKEEIELYKIIEEEKQEYEYLFDKGYITIDEILEINNSYTNEKTSSKKQYAKAK